MLIKFLPKVKSPALKIIKDLDKRLTNRYAVTTMRGNPEMTGLLADSLLFRNRLTRCIIAWSPEDWPSKVETDNFLLDFERLAWAGIEPVDYHWTAIRHRKENGATDIHIFIANVNLKTGKALNIAPPGSQYAFRLLQELYNTYYNWASPGDPELARNAQPGHERLYDTFRKRKGLKPKEGPRTRIGKYLDRLESENLLNTREDVIEALEAFGTILRTGKEYIAIDHHGTDRRLRLKGRVFHKNYSNRPKGRKENSGESNSIKFEGIKMKLDKAYEKRFTYHQTRHGPDDNPDILPWIFPETWEIESPTQNRGLTL